MKNLTDVPPATESHRDDARLIGCTGPVASLLRQLAELVTSLTDAQYVQKPVGVVESSIGGHLRHVLDHVRSALDSASASEFTYDVRSRGTVIETSRPEALAEIDGLVARLGSLGHNVVDRPLTLSVLMTSDGAPVRVTSSVGRELAFAMQHTVHHNALIAAMLKTLGVPMPNRFGYAPATVQHLETTACAR